MKIVHLVSGDLDGGAAKSAVMLHNHLLDKLHVDSILITNSRNLGYLPGVRYITSNPFNWLMTKIVRRIDFLISSYFYRRKNQTLFSTGFFGLVGHNHPDIVNADIIHLHWICNLISLRQISKLCSKKIVWTARDMWPFTGGCHYSLSCSRLIKGCGSCPELNSKKNRDLSSIIFEKKQNVLDKIDTLINVSDWMDDIYRQSHTHLTLKTDVIPNAILDFNPRNNKGAADNSQFLFIAQNINEFYKGFDLLCAALNLLDKKITEPVTLKIVGRGDSNKLKNLRNVKVEFLGFLNSRQLDDCFGSVRCLIFPSRMDAAPKVPIEALSHKIPVVCFEGISLEKFVTHAKTGYIARREDPNDLCEGLIWVLNTPIAALQADCLAASSMIRERYSISKISELYLDLYRRLVS